MGSPQALSPRHNTWFHSQSTLDCYGYAMFHDLSFRVRDWTHWDQFPDDYWMLCGMTRKNGGVRFGVLNNDLVKLGSTNAISVLFSMLSIASHRDRVLNSDWIALADMRQAAPFSYFDLKPHLDVVMEYDRFVGSEFRKVMLSDQDPQRGVNLGAEAESLGRWLMALAEQAVCDYAESRE